MLLLLTTKLPANNIVYVQTVYIRTWLLMIKIEGKHDMVCVFHDIFSWHFEPQKFDHSIKSKVTPLTHITHHKKNAAIFAEIPRTFYQQKYMFTFGGNNR